MKLSTRILVLLTGLFLSLNSYGQIASGTYYVNTGDPSTGFVNFTGPLSSAGTITIIADSLTVTGNLTQFNEAMVGTNIYTAPTSVSPLPVLIGTVAAYVSPTEIMLSEPYVPGLPAGSLYCLADAPGAFATLNAFGISGDVSLALAADQSEFTAEPGTNALLGSGLNGHAVSIVNGGGSFIDGANAPGNLPGVIRLSGCSNVLIDGMYFRNEKPGAPCVILTNGSNHNTIRNCTFETQNTTATASTSTGALNFGTSAVAGGNSYNTIDACMFRDRTDAPLVGNYGICSFGTAAEGSYNEHNTISTCTFHNLESASVWVTSTGNGGGWQLKANVFQHDNITQTATGAIYFDAGLTSDSNLVTNNVINGWADGGTNVFNAIYLNTGINSTSVITGNTVANMTMNGGNSGFSGIYVAGGKMTIGGPGEGEANTIVGNTVSGSGINTAIHIAGGMDLNVTHNVIASNITTSTGQVAPVIGISVLAATGITTLSYNTINALTQTGVISVLSGINIEGGADFVISNNDISGHVNNGTGSASLYGIRISGGNAIQIRRNLIYSNRLAGTTGTLAGIYNSAAIGLIEADSNSIYDLQGTGTGMLAGIYSTSGANARFTTNTIYDLAFAGTGGVSRLSGIEISGATNYEIERNHIFSLTNGNVTSNGAAVGIKATSAGAAVGIYNNQIYSLRQEGEGSLTGIFGLSQQENSLFTITSNGISNLVRSNTVSANTAQVAGIFVPAGTGANSAIIKNNLIKTLIGSAIYTGSGNPSSVFGIYNYATGTSGQSISDNTISDLQSSYVGPTAITITGIALSGPAVSSGPDFNICGQNSIYIDGNSVNGPTLIAANIIGVNVQGAAYDLVNNMILLGYDNQNFTNDHPYVLSGIKKSSGVAAVNNSYFNSIYIVGTSNTSIAGNYSACYTAEGGSNTTDDIRNNIFSNKRTNTGSAGTHYALFFNPLNTFDHNDYFVNGTGGVLSNGANSLPLKAGEDAQSISIDPFFQYTKNPVPGLGNLHVLNRCALNDKGISLAGNTPRYVKDAFDIMRAETPDMGAKEFEAGGTFHATVSASATVINKCSPVAVQLNTSNTFCTPVTYSWSPAAGLDFTDIANPLANPLITTTYIVTISDGSSSATASTTIRVNPSIEIGNASVCTGSLKAQLPYADSTRNIDKYSIVWDAAGHTAGLRDTINVIFDSLLRDATNTPVIEFLIPTGFSEGAIYNGVLTAENSDAACFSEGFPFELTVVSSKPPNIDWPFIQTPYPAYTGDNITLTTLSPDPSPTVWAWYPIDILGFTGYGTTINSLSDVPELNNVLYDGGSIRGPGNVWWIVQGANACGVGADWGPLRFTQVVPPTRFSNPVDCSNSGTISFPGLIPFVTYDVVSITKDGVPLDSIRGIAADATGLFTIGGLGAGTYTNIVLWGNTGYAVNSYPADAITLIGPEPPVATLSGEVTACTGVGGITYTTESGATNYQWTISGGTITSGGGMNDNSATVTWNTAGEQSISVSYFNVCPTVAPAVVLVDVTICGVAPTVAFQNPLTACFSTQGQTTNLDYTATESPDQYKITWDPTATTQGFANIQYTAGNLSASPLVISIPAGTDAGTYTGTLMVKNGVTGIQSAAYPVSVIVNALPEPTLSTTGEGDCLSASGNVYTTQPAQSNYVWTVTGGNISAGGGSGDNTATVVWTSTDDKHISAGYTNTEGCSGTSAQLQIVGNPSPDAQFEYTIGPGYEVHFSNLSSNATGYFWIFGDGATSTASVPTHLYSFDGPYEVKLVATNACGSDTIIVLVIIPGPGGFKDPDGTQLSIYPNPFTETIHISINAETREELNLAIYNVLGQFVYASTLTTGADQTIQLNLSSLPTGIYTVQLSNEKKQINRKIIKSN